jgi:hypothetical protein
MLLQLNFAQQLHLSEIPKEPALIFVGEVVVAIVVATARCTRVATSTQLKPELNNSPFN